MIESGGCGCLAFLLTTLLVLLAVALLPLLWLFGITELTAWLSGWQPFWHCYPAGGGC